MWIVLVLCCREGSRDGYASKNPVLHVKVCSARWLSVLFLVFAVFVLFLVARTLVLENVSMYNLLSQFLATSTGLFVSLLL